MDSNDATDVIAAVCHYDNSNSNKRDAIETSTTNDDQHNVGQNVEHSTVNEGVKENKDVGDDQESVILEEAENDTIDLNEESEEESEQITDLPNSANNSTKATEFVIVNASNISASITEVAETANRYTVEDIQIKDELSEVITADLNTNDVLENDPMDLLELNHRSDSSSSSRLQEDTDYADDGSSIGSSSVQTGSSSSTSVLDWIKDYPWLLYDESDEPLGYCLYCDVKINTKSQRSVKQHGLSLYHKERCENYLAFREEEEKNGLGMKLVEIKEEFGTDSRVEALKLKRKSQSAALNNFNWRRWLEDCPWLERDSTEGTIGFCKYCLLHVNVEFSYLRVRHQEGTKHREAEKQHEASNEPEEQNKSTAHEEKDKDFASESRQLKNHKWLELLEKEPTMARCKICGYKMLQTNFLRHLTTKLHEHNEKIYVENQHAEKQDEADGDSAKNNQNWESYAKNHPWMQSDPEDPSFAHCKYCEKRLVYGSSAVKRSVHENSSQHKQNEIEFKKRARNLKNNKKKDENDTEGNNEEEDAENQAEAENEEVKDPNEENAEDNEEEGDAEENNESDNEDNKDDEEEEADNEEEGEQEKESDEENESKKRVYKLTDEWISQYPWCKRYKKDPTNFMYCTYCRIPLKISNSRSKHQKSSFHISAEKEFLSRQTKKQKVQERKQNNESAPFFEWAIYLRNNPSIYSCRYCRVRISKNYSKKQHASSKIHQINESLYKNNRRTLRKDEPVNTEPSSQTPKEVVQQSNIATTKKVVIKAPSTVTLIKQYQKKFPWLSYKRSELRTHYGHCKICDSSLYIRSLKHVMRHTRSGRHISFMKAKKKQKTEKIEGVEDGEVNVKVDNKLAKEDLQTTADQIENSSQNRKNAPSITTTGRGESATHAFESQKAFNYKSTIAEMKKRFSWIEKSDKQNYAFCRFCSSNIPLKILFLRNHSNSPKHRRSVTNYFSKDAKKVNRERTQDLDTESKSGDVENELIIVEDNNEEILISEQDENWTVKSETMDEHEELDYLLQRSFNNMQNSSNTQRNVRKRVNTDDEPATKRVKRSHSFRRLNESNSSLVASLLSTPLTLASCLGPLIQQQIQQQTNLSQSQSNLSVTSVPDITKTSTSLVSEPENTYDLFFKSISETIKKLPTDLAAEGKLRVMQVVCDLELQALKREQSARNDSLSSNTSGSLSCQTTATPPIINPACNNTVIGDIIPEHANTNETTNTQLNVNTDVSSPSTTNNHTATTTTNLISSKPSNPSTVENPTASCPSPIIGVMDRNGLQTLQLKTAVSKQTPRNTTTTTITSVANSGIRCIPFKNLSQPVASDSANQKVTRIQVPMNVPNHTPNPNANAVNASKNLINFRNIQITKRLGTTPNSVTPTTASPQTVQKTPTMANKSPQRTFITNIQPQLQRWGCSVNGSTSHQIPTSTTVSHLQQLSSQHTSTPISKK